MIRERGALASARAERTTPATLSDRPGAGSIAGDAIVHPHVDAMHALLECADEATIGQLAALIQLISRDLSFFPAAFGNVPDEVAGVFADARLALSDQPLDREQLFDLGSLLSEES